MKKTAGSALYGVQIAHQGKRHRFPLGTANREVAADKARAIYLSLVANGTDVTLVAQKPHKYAPYAAPGSATVGQLIEAAGRLSPARWESMETYSQALRRLVAAVLGWDGGAGRFTQEGAKQWREKIDAVPLVSITPVMVQEWRTTYLKSAATPAARDAAIVTSNSLVRNSQALVSKKIRTNLAKLVPLPDVLWFHGFVQETPPPLRYKSRIDAGEILRAGLEEFSQKNPEVLKCLVLTLACGLRRSEADSLMWSQFNAEESKLEIADNQHKRLKSKGSAGDVSLDPEIVSMMKKWQEQAKGAFVLEPESSPGPKPVTKQFRRYRANHTHLKLLAWLREKGVPGKRPLHVMRKEVGSIIATKQGIFAASRFLRHSDIAITAKLYADPKEPVTSGLGSLLKLEVENVVQANFRPVTTPAPKTVKTPKTKA